jgi:ABC-type sugar transport system permease subunit
MTAVDTAPAADARPAAYPDWFVKRRRRGNLIVSAWVPTVMVGIPILILAVIVIYPTIWMAYHAFQNTSMMSLFSENWQFVGWQNFADTLQDDRFISSVWHLVRYLLFGACLQVILGVAIALILYEVVQNNTLRW